MKPGSTYEKMYECSACSSVFLIAIYRRPKSMPCLHEPLHCPFCMSAGNTLTRLHQARPDKERVVKEIKSDGTIVEMNRREEREWRKKVKTKIAPSQEQAVGG
jgi:hypothetical protein